MDIEENRLKMNLIVCSGEIVNTLYDDFHNTLLITVSAKHWNLNPKREPELITDIPEFTYTGEDAGALNEKLQIGGRITILGHTSQELMYVPGKDGNMQQKFQTVLYADSVTELSVSGTDENCCILAGKITRVYRRPEPGKRFYIINVQTDDKEKNPAIASFIYFDGEMGLEPKKGDFIKAVGSFQVKETTDKNGNVKSLTSIVAKTVGLKRKKNEMQNSAENSLEDYNTKCRFFSASVIKNPNGTITEVNCSCGMDMDYCSANCAFAEEPKKKKAGRG